MLLRLRWPFPSSKADHLVVGNKSVWSDTSRICCCVSCRRGLGQERVCPFGRGTVTSAASVVLPAAVGGALVMRRATVLQGLAASESVVWRGKSGEVGVTLKEDGIHQGTKWVINYSAAIYHVTDTSGGFLSW